MTPPALIAPNISAYFASVRQGRHAWWAWLVGIAGILALYLTASFALFAFIYAFEIAQSTDVIYPGLIVAELVSYVGLIISFLPLFFAVLLIHRYWHARPIKTLLTSAARFRWGNTVRSMIVLVAVYLALTPISYWLEPETFDDVVFVADLRVFAIGLVLTLIFIPFQAASEEILVRGYLNQALIKYVKYPWVAFIATSLFFAYLHAQNPESEGQMLPYMMSVFIFGISMCVLLYFEGGLESAIGIHVANNIFAFSFMGYEDPYLPEMALWSSGPPQIEMIDILWETLSVAIVVVLTILWNRRVAARPSRP